MKKLRLLVLLALLIPCINASCKEEYSEWTTEKPLLENIELQTEERYLYYELIEKDIEYLSYEEHLEKNKEEIDFNDYNWSNYENVLFLPDKTEHNEIITNTYEIEEEYNEVLYIKISNEYPDNNSFTISNLSFTDEINSLNIEFEKIEENATNYNEDGSVTILNNGYILYKLERVFNADEVSVFFMLLRSEFENDDKEVNIYYYKDDNMQTYEMIKSFTFNYNLVECVNLKIYDNGLDTFVSSYTVSKQEYLVREKLYKSFNYERNEIGYFSSLDGNYLKEDTPVTFYRYKIIEEEPKKQINEENNNPDINNDAKEDSTSNQKIEYNYEYFYTYPLDYSDDNTQYKIYESSEEEIESIELKEKIQTNKYLSTNTNDTSKNDIDYFQIFATICYLSILVLIITLLVLKIHSYSKKH